MALAAGRPARAAAVALLAWGRPARGPGRLAALGAAAGIAAWSAPPSRGRRRPDLAWIDANRVAIALCALALGLALGALVPRAPLWSGSALAAGALLPVVFALGTKIVPARSATTATWPGSPRPSATGTRWRWWR